MIDGMRGLRRSLPGLVAAMLGLGMVSPRRLHAETQPFVVPIIRPNIGLLALLTDEKERGLAFHLPLGAAIGWSGSGFGRIFGATPWVLPELGYELRTSGHHDSHVASIGCGIGYGVLAPIIGTYTPRVLIGWADGQTAVGFRHGIAFHALMTAVSLEVSHQVLHVGESFSHEIQLTAGLNLGPLLLAALW